MKPTIGGKNKNHHKDEKTEGGQGCGGDDRTAVVGILQLDAN